MRALFPLAPLCGGVFFFEVGNIAIRFLSRSKYSLTIGRDPKSSEQSANFLLGARTARPHTARNTHDRLKCRRRTGCPRSRHPGRLAAMNFFATDRFLPSYGEFG